MRTFKGICLGLLVSVPYGLIPGFFILGILGGLSSSFLPGISRMWDESFGPMALMSISIFVGMFVFPFAGAIWVNEQFEVEGAPLREDKKKKKRKITLTTLIIHTLIAYTILVGVAA